MSFKVGKPEGIVDFFGEKYVKTDKKHIDKPVIIEKIFKGFDEQTGESYVAIGGNMAGICVWFYAPTYDTSGINQIDDSDIDILCGGSYCYIVEHRKSADNNREYYIGYVELRGALTNKG